MKLTISVPRVAGGVCLNSLRKVHCCHWGGEHRDRAGPRLVVLGSSSCVEALRGVRCQSSPVSLIGGAFHEVRLVCQPVGRWGRKFPRGISAGPLGPVRVRKVPGETAAPRRGLTRRSGS